MNITHQSYMYVLSHFNYFICKELLILVISTLTYYINANYNFILWSNSIATQTKDCFIPFKFKMSKLNQMIMEIQTFVSHKLIGDDTMKARPSNPLLDTAHDWALVPQSPTVVSKNNSSIVCLICFCVL